MRLVAANLILYGALFFLNSGCATIVTEGQLKPINKSEASTQISKTVSLRYLKETVLVERVGIAPSTSFSRNPLAEEAMKKSFNKVVSSKSIEIVSFPLEEINFDDRNHRIRKNLIEDPIEQAKTDFFIDIHLIKQKADGQPLNEFLIPFAILSIGFIPYYSPVAIHLEATVYNKTTKLTKKYSIDDRYTIWQWTPLVIAPGSFWPANKNYIQEKMNISFENLFDKMNKEGAFL